MKKIAVLFLALIYLGFQAPFVSAQLAGGPKIIAKELRHDLGIVKQGTEASHVFEIRNEGNQTLIIEKVQPG